MTTQAAIQAQIWQGFAILAGQIGAPCQWFRPGPANYSVGTAMGTVQAYIDTLPNFASVRPQQRKMPELFAALDASLVLLGDYLTDTKWGTTFVATLDPFRAATLIECNAVVTLSRPSEAAPGSGYYGGDGTRAALATGWPCAILPGGRGTRDAGALPESDRNDGVIIYLPATLPAQPRPGDVLTDRQAELPKVSAAPAAGMAAEVDPLDYLVTGVWETSLGWQLNAIIRTP